MLNRFLRQELIFGKDGQERISKTKVGIIGLGGLGSIVAQNLAYLGVKEYILVDDDIVEDTNLNRLVSSYPSDLISITYKVDAAKRMIKQINKDCNVRNFKSNLRNKEVIKLLTDTDILFGCVDNDSARLILSELSSAYMKTLIDLAFEITTKDRKIVDFGGRVVVARPGEFCLLCANQIDLDTAQVELESPPLRNFREEHGYGLGKEVKAPSVICLNTIIAGLAVTEFQMLVTGLREPNKMLIYKGERGIVTSRIDEKNPDCIICNNLLGSKEYANIERYIHNTLPNDLPVLSVSAN